MHRLNDKVFIPDDCRDSSLASNVPNLQTQHLCDTICLSVLRFFVRATSYGSQLKRFAGASNYIDDLNTRNRNKF